MVSKGNAAVQLEKEKLFFHDKMLLLLLFNYAHEHILLDSISVCGEI